VKLQKIDHIGIAVKSIDQALSVYEGVLGLKPAGLEEVVDQKVRVAFLPLGDSEVELLESTSPDGAIARYIEKNGEGVQHVAFRVDDLEATLARLKERGVRLIDEKPRYGAGGARIAFLHPKATGGVLIELCERE
jgi:methylmalonyl-CoA/ethylmalonyl-CoA epimerase